MWMKKRIAIGTWNKKTTLYRTLDAHIFVSDIVVKIKCSFSGMSKAYCDYLLELASQV